MCYVLLFCTAVAQPTPACTLRHYSRLTRTLKLPHVDLVHVLKVMYKKQPAVIDVQAWEERESQQHVERLYFTEDDCMELCGVLDRGNSLLPPTRRVFPNGMNIGFLRL